MGEREGLIARIRQVRRAAAAADTSARPAPVNPEHSQVQALEARVAHLEKLIAELEARIQPGAMGAALSEDARKRGL
jgi:hypothetical protein